MVSVDRLCGPKPSVKLRCRVLSQGRPPPGAVGRKACRCRTRRVCTKPPSTARTRPAAWLPLTPRTPRPSARSCGTACMNRAEQHPQARWPWAACDAAEPLALADLVDGNRGEPLHRQAADLEVPDAQLAQVGVGRTDSGLAAKRPRTDAAPAVDARAVARTPLPSASQTSARNSGRSSARTRSSWPLSLTPASGSSRASDRAADPLTAAPRPIRGGATRPGR